MSNSLGEKFRITSFGESHGKCVGVVIDGCPSGLSLSEDDIQPELNRRRPGQSQITTKRQEEDQVEILSGVFNGYTTGAPICMLIWNKDVDSTKYELFRDVPRPGHADFTARQKYGGFNDYRGGGRFSGRITASFVMAGAVARKLLRDVLNVDITAHTIEIGGIKAKKIEDISLIKKNVEKTPIRTADLETAEKMIELVIQAENEGDSIGGIIECIVTNVPIGLGEPIFSSLESDISKAIFSIPAVKGIEFGAGFRVSRMKGSENNDKFTFKNGQILTKTNNAGGILGGISTGMPITFRIAIKPTASITKKQESVSISEKKETELQIEGRHDPCIVPRAVPVVESMTAMVLADHAIRYNVIPPVIRRMTS
ncbi:chorismate synthase [Candidatus Borrarchaeum sp.]|uniref:chorismate synthase n=1 Tax=Candidatus Borrarchaeum sp. TaxID=2846742 RepID=UPI00258000C7|nr:chorismate synthase [Candidatus Borrarchaeum sp.]